MNITSTLLVKSAKYAGVSATFRRPGVWTRASLEIDTSALREERARLNAAFRAAIPESEPDREFTSDELPVVNSLVDRLKANLLAIKRAWFDKLLLSIDGFTVDGQPASRAQFLDFAPEDLIDEIFAGLEREAYLDPVTEKNSQLPITSGAREGGQINATIVSDARN